MHYKCVEATKDQIKLEFPIDYECPRHSQNKPSDSCKGKQQDDDKSKNIIKHREPRDCSSKMGQERNEIEQQIQTRENTHNDSAKEPKEIENGSTKETESRDGQPKSKVDNDKQLGQTERKDQDNVKVPEEQINRNRETRSIEIRD